MFFEDVFTKLIQKRIRKFFFKNQNIDINDYAFTNFFLIKAIFFIFHYHEFIYYINKKIFAKIIAYCTILYCIVFFTKLIGSIG